MQVVLDDGGRAAAGFKGSAGDCVTRAIVIASGLPYREVYDELATQTGAQRAGKRGKRAASARDGINTTRKWFKDYITRLGFTWHPTMRIGSGCKVHLTDGELPMGRLVVAVSRHYTAVIDGVIHDTYNPQRDKSLFYYVDGTMTEIGGRCVYGYWRLETP
jgi:hypothetical protein